MTGYYFQLAFRNLRHNPGLTALMIGAVALGIAVCVMTLTMYRAMSGNPIWWKNDVLYALTFDAWDPNKPDDEKHPELPPPQLTYKDATAMFAVRHSAPPGHHAQGDGRAAGRGCRHQADARADARDDGGFLRDVRRAVQVRRRLVGGGRPRPGAGARAVAGTNDKFSAASTVSAAGRRRPIAAPSPCSCCRRRPT